MKWLIDNKFSFIDVVFLIWVSRAIVDKEYFAAFIVFLVSVFAGAIQGYLHNKKP